MSNIIFDFDGTIADTFATVVGIFHELTHRDETLPLDEVERLRGMSLMHAAAELKVQPWKIPFLVARGRQRMRSQMYSIKAFDGMPDAITELRGQGHNLYIMSSNSVQNIQLFLKRHDMDKEFIKIYGGVGLLGKARVLRKVLKQNKLDPADTFYVGDEVRDIQGAKHAGLQMIAVTWGYNNETVLAAHDPDQLARKPKDIVRIFE